MTHRAALLALVILTASLARAGCQAPSWQPTLLNNLAAASIVAVDLDHDGAPDVAGITATSAFVLRNDGTGTFAPPVTVYSGAPRGTIVTADFNGDGHADLAFAGNNALIVLPGKGDGTFGNAIESAIAIQPAQLAAARLDADTNVDLAAFDAAALKLVTFRGNGAGGFTEVQTSAIASAATVMTVADLDGDGKMDAVIAYQSRTAFDAFYGRGDGTFDPKVTINGTGDSVGLQAADLDGDGLPELAAVATRGPVAVIPNLGGRAFAAPQLYSIFRDTLLLNLTVADVTRDGKPDIAMASGCGLRTSTNSGTGTMTTPWSFDWLGCTLPFPSRGGLAAADFDRDGRVDLMVSIPHSEASGDVLGFRNLCGDSNMTLTTQSPTIAVGQTLTVDVNVAPPTFDENGAGIAATGNVTLREGDNVFGVKPLVSQPGSAGTRFVIDGLAAGDHTLVADYAGDAQYDARPSPPLVIHVGSGIPTTTTLTADPPVGTYGAGVQLTATVTSSSGDTPSGPIRFTADGNVFTNVSGPTATIGVGHDTPGTHTFSAQFLGDATHQPSSATLTYLVNKQVPGISVLPPSATAGALDQGFDVDVDEIIGGDDPTGTLSVRLGDFDLGTRTLVALHNHQHFSFPAAGAGRYTLRATYSGNAHYAAVDTVIPFIIYPASGFAADARGSQRGVVVTWNGANRLGFRRKAGDAAWSFCCATSGDLDQSPQRETVYLYRSATSLGSDASPADLAMLFTFTEDPLLPEEHVTPLQLNEVIRALNIVRSAAGLAPVTPPPAIASASRRRSFGGNNVPASSVASLRDAINEAREKLGAYRVDFIAPIADPAMTGAQLQELREAIR